MAAVQSLNRTLAEARIERDGKCASLRAASEKRGHDLHPWSIGNSGTSASTACRKCGCTVTITVTASRSSVVAAGLSKRCPR